MAEVITKDINIQELVAKHPDSARIFAAYGIGCLGCSMARFETVGQGLDAHGINVDDFLKDLNAYIAGEK